MWLFLGKRSASAPRISSMFVIAASVLSVFVITPAVAVETRARLPVSPGARPFPGTSFTHFGRPLLGRLPLIARLGPAGGLPAVAAWSPGKWRGYDNALATRHLADTATRLLGPARGRHRRVRAEYVAGRAIGDT
jgi:hypothetical protein